MSRPPRTKKMIFLATTAALLTIGIVGWKQTARAGYESADYTVVESDGKFEIRDYPDLMLVATKTKVDSQGRDGSFMKLFRYISGDNQTEQKIAMTTPVFMQDGAEDSGDDVVQMGFVMPKSLGTDQVPQPTGPDVEVQRRPAGRFAVYQFPGRINRDLAQKAQSTLQTWMADKGLVADDSPGSIETASYDPPFTPGPLRRNEILIRLKP